MQPSTNQAQLDGRRISAISEQLGIPVPTIRSWERRYGFPSPDRTQGRHRRYTLEEIEQLREVRDRITRGERTGEAIAAVRIAEVEPPARNAYLDAFAQAADRLDTELLHDTLRQAADALGPDRAITEIALPGMRAVGSRWKAGLADIANEHAVSEVAHRWLGSMGAEAPPPYRRSTMLLTGAPGERHTIGLEAFAVVLGRRGWPTRLLGADTPVSSLVAAVRATDASGVIVSAQRSVVRRAAIAALDAIERLAGVHGFYAGNAFAATRTRVDVPGTYLGDDILAAADILAATMGER